MKSIFVLFLILLCIASAFSQEIPEKIIKTDVSDVTIFIEGAQVTRKKSVDLAAGESILKFTDLSPFVDAKSIQVKADGNITVLSVNHQQNFLEKLQKPKELTDLELKIKGIDNNIKLEKTYLDIIKEELAFLTENRDVSNSLKEISLTSLKDISTFYSTNLKILKLSEIEHNQNIEDFEKQKAAIASQINTMTNKKEFATSEILVKVSAKSAARVDFELSYLVNNASWFPSYDLRAKSINDPIQLIYKANVRQDTKEDWKNIKLRFSSSDPNKTGLAPELRTYFLSYNTLPPVYNRAVSLVSGKISDSNNEALPGVTILVEGTTIGTISDANGNYSISIPNNGGNLVYAYVGYVSQTHPVTNPVMNVMLEEDVVMLQEVVVTGYGTTRDEDAAERMQGKVSGITMSIQAGNNIKIRGANSIPVASEMVEKQTTVNFEIKTPYTVLSDNKNYSVDMAAYDLPADYQYYCAPKIDKDAFLMANIIEWEKYNLLEGEANIFFEDTYIGKSLLDVRYASDTLHISLGRDKNVSVSREKVKNYTTRQFIGSKKVETRDWLITVKNNKSQKINMLVLDQVPVSTMEEIEIEIQNASGALEDDEKGEMKWIFSLEPNTKKEIDLRYTVKYPKYKSLVIE